MPLLHGGIFRIGFSLAFFDIVQSLVAYGGKPHPENSPMQKSCSLVFTLGGVFFEFFKKMCLNQKKRY